MEAGYIDKQQGTYCEGCGSNIRSLALANAIRAFFGTHRLLQDIDPTNFITDFSILEINEAGNLTPSLKELGTYTFGAYPEVDMHALPYDNGTFDMIVHSDTLEHVRNPQHALSECLRVLKPGGGLCFTVPVIIGRISRNRDGLAKSYHGVPKLAADDFVVHTEFGADAWTYILDAGFTELSIYTFAYPAGIAFMAKRPAISMGSRK